VIDAGLERNRSDDMHALRHWDALVLLEAGVSIKALSEYLGHADPGLPLRTYTHRMPNTEEEAVDRALTDMSLSPKAPVISTWFEQRPHTASRATRGFR
jgi:hypothetical protein